MSHVKANMLQCTPNISSCRISTEASSRFVLKAIILRICSVHISGFLLGAKPSRYQQLTFELNVLNVFEIPIMNTLRFAKPKPTEVPTIIFPTYLDERMNILTAMEKANELFGDLKGLLDTLQNSRN